MNLKDHVLVDMSEHFEAAYLDLTKDIPTFLIDKESEDRKAALQALFTGLYVKAGERLAAAGNTEEDVLQVISSLHENAVVAAKEAGTTDSEDAELIALVYVWIDRWVARLDVEAMDALVELENELSGEF